MKQGNKKISCHIITATIYLLAIMALTALLSRYMVTNYLSETVVNSLVTAVLFLSTLIANMTGQKIGQEKNLISIALNTGIMLAILFIASAAVDGQYQSIGMGIGAIIMGAIVSGFIGTRNTGKSKARRRYR